MRNRLIVLVLVLVLAGFAHARSSYTAAGVWQSSTGARITIPQSPTDFDIIYQYPHHGRRLLLRGHWVRGMVGTQFFYDFGGRRAYCTINVNNPNQLRVDGPGGASYWTRIGW